MQDHPNPGAPPGARRPEVQHRVQRWVLLELITAPPPEGDDISKIAFGLKELRPDVNAAVDALVAAAWPSVRATAPARPRRRCGSTSCGGCGHDRPRGAAARQPRQHGPAGRPLHPAGRSSGPALDRGDRPRDDRPPRRLRLRDAVKNAIRDLVGASFHRHGAFVFATHAAVRFDELRIYTWSIHTTGKGVRLAAGARAESRCAPTRPCAPSEPWSAWRSRRCRRRSSRPRCNPPAHRASAAATPRARGLRHPAHRSAAPLPPDPPPRRARPPGHRPRRAPTYRGALGRGAGRPNGPGRHAVDPRLRRRRLRPARRPRRPGPRSDARRTRTRERNRPREGPARPPRRLARQHPRPTPTATYAAHLTDPRDLAADLTRIRQRGYATDHGEHHEDVHALAAQVFHADKAVAALASRSQRRNPRRQTSARSPPASSTTRRHLTPRPTSD